MHEQSMEDFVARYVHDGDVVSIGTSEAGERFVKKLALSAEQRGIHVKFVPGSARLAALASACHLPMVSLNDHEVDVGIEFAAQVDEDLNYVKRDTHSLILDKMIAQSAAELFVVAEARHLVERLHGSIPFEVAAFGWKRTLAALERMGRASLRLEHGTPFKTETGNYLVDVKVDNLYSYEDLDFQAKDLAGVLETGLFLGYADKLVLHDKHIRLIDRADHLKAFAHPEKAL
ncbi:MAG: ribose-5-phosphate isomerase A [Candidatus Diapherotrites archaeon]|uniref:ribose-5-phosphate isomerase n=1 Tax=Candidatus Iainarchaeum sp. TaxID=3101447 RepID=A0A8T4L7M9_9ARCH|nr:ribose-5-phosphate isomerase A [Candidatus Diapherotrites archaeon]